MTERFKIAVRGQFVILSGHSDVILNDILQERLWHSQYGEDEHINELTEVFDKTTKRLFRDANKSYYLKFGNRKVNDITNHIRAGQLTVDGYASPGLLSVT